MSTTQSFPRPIAASNAKKATFPPAFEVEEPTPPYTIAPEAPVAPIAPIIREDQVAAETAASTSAGANVATDYIDVRHVSPSVLRIDLPTCSTACNQP